MHRQQHPQQCGLACMPEAMEGWRQESHARDLGLSGSVFAYLHIQQLWGKQGFVPACRAGHKSFVLLVLS